MHSYALIFIVALGISFALLPFARSLSWRWGILDHPSGRKVHLQPTPLLGGVAIYGGFALTIALLAREDRDFLFFLLASLYLLVIGLIDDRFDIQARHRIFLQAAAAVAVIATGISFSLGMGVIIAGAVTLLWLLGIVNSTNCLDCIDGAAGTYAFVACCWFFALALQHGRLSIASLAVALAGAVLGFLLWNFPPASIFMGDLGSTFLGLMLGVLSIASGIPYQKQFRFPFEALVLAPIAYDFLLVHVRRYRAGTRNVRDLLSSTGKDHLPHRLLAIALTPREADLYLAALASLWGLTALLLVQGHLAAVAAGALALIALFFGEGVLYRLTGARRHRLGAAASPRASEEAFETGSAGD